MFIPISPKYVPIDMDSLENETVVEARIFRGTGSSAGSYSSSIDPSDLSANSLVVLPFCSIAEVRDLDATADRLAITGERLIKLTNGEQWRMFIRIHFLSLQEDQVPAEVREVARTGTIFGSFPSNQIHEDLIDYFRLTVSAKWSQICLEIRQHELVMEEFGVSIWENVERYREMLRLRPDQAEMREHYLSALRDVLKGLDLSDPTRMDTDLFSLGLINRVLELGPLAPLFALSPLIKEQMQTVELARASQLSRLEMLVDEGGAEWTSNYGIRDLRNVRPILPIELDSDKETKDASTREKSQSNPYRRGLELFLTIEEKLGAPYVRLAGQIACAPARLLSKELTVQQLRAVDESTPWHPTTRLRRIADLTPEEIARIRSTQLLPHKVVALFSIIDTPLPPPSKFSYDLLANSEMER